MTREPEYYIEDFVELPAAGALLAHMERECAAAGIDINEL